MGENYKTPSTGEKRAPSHPLWVKAVYWCFAIVFFGYGVAIAVLDTAESPYFVAWLSLTKPITDFLISIIPGASFRLEGMGVSAYASRVPLVAHAYAAALVLGALMSLMGAPYYTGRKALRPVRYAMNSKLLNGVLSFFIGGGLIFTLNVIRDFDPETIHHREALFAGHMNNFALVWEFIFYEMFFLLTVMGAVLLLDALAQNFWRKGSDLDGPR